MPRFKALIEYDGAPFMGWQRQKHGPSVQAVVEDALTQATGSRSLVQASGRTDTGVHAEAMPVHFDVTNPRFDANRIREALNSLMRPNPVACLSVEQVADDFNARFDCIRRYYRYQIWNRRPDLALGRDQCTSEVYWTQWPCKTRPSIYWANMISPAFAPPNARQNHQSKPLML